jgi:hypothetical protein
VHAEAHHIILSGSGGNAEYQQKFLDWGNRLRTALIDKSGCDPDHVILLSEMTSQANGEQGDEVSFPGRTQPCTLDNIRAAFDALAQHPEQIDELFVYLIGHGSHRNGVSKFNVPGPDLSAEELDALLAPFVDRRCIVINASSSSAGFINVLSGPNRIICTATKSTEERNATEFMAFFVEGLEEGSADRDRDGRISLWEACTQAVALTDAWYTSEGLISTEHALLDDNGDALGTRLSLNLTAAPNQTLDGEAAGRCFIRDHVFPPQVPPALIAAYRDALGAVEAHIREKSEPLDPAYHTKLESLLVKAARANRAIRK